MPTFHMGFRPFPPPFRRACKVTLLPWVAMSHEAAERSPLSHHSTLLKPTPYSSRGPHENRSWNRHLDSAEGRYAAFEREALDDLRALGVDPVPVELPTQYPIGSTRIVLNAGSAAAFDELSRSGRHDLLVRQDAGAWPCSFRRARMIPGVEVIQASRVRTMGR